MRLYHFTSAQAAESIRRTGLSRGRVVTLAQSGMREVIPGWQWLTTMPAFDAQTWTTKESKYRNRGQARIEVVPDLRCCYRWTDMRHRISALADWLSAGGDYWNWWLHWGSIRPDQIMEIRLADSAEPVHGVPVLRRA